MHNSCLFACFFFSRNNSLLMLFIYLPCVFHAFCVSLSSFFALYVTIVQCLYASQLSFCMFFFFREIIPFLSCVRICLPCVFYAYCVSLSSFLALYDTIVNAYLHKDCLSTCVFRGILPFLSCVSVVHVCSMLIVYLCLLFLLYMIL